VTGIAAPIFDSGDHVMGSLSLTVGRTGLTPGEVADIASRVVYCAQVVSGALSTPHEAGFWSSPAAHPHAEAVPLHPVEDSRMSTAFPDSLPAGRRAGKAG
jgi:hypothetical protein